MNGKYKSLQVSGESGAELEFSMEPIVRLADGIVFAYELLYRGPRPCDFAETDHSLLRYLGSTTQRFPTLFVNLANATMINLRDDDLLAASKRHKLYFELSEAFAPPEIFAKIARRANELTRRGVHFALDDFGAGQDGLKRIMALDSIDVIKIDGSLIDCALRHASAENLLRDLIHVWKKSDVLTIAECVSSTELLHFVEGLGVDMVQGYLFNCSQFDSRKMPGKMRNRVHAHYLPSSERRDV